ncbi:hypothetical protein QCD83_05670 [Pseudomonas savastanoi pv. phaseolicola]|nr:MULTISPECIES: hypothetical protein [Pseudomonas]KPB85819.1 Uncharacterized protein AC504_0197 [Pseudomonas syringae pv. maculicola]EFW80629.1 hypothetical protein PsgB076_11515 [Pseudomonas savastanoi pv. glycinea str. B076]EFW84924.1 hypothetical protein PsgRace4_16599 [Pseudomonas savastanoi pv. glycinea str. race 4]KPB40490.1 Uncharacterized protein AC514_4717 [Pseudomonas savastanoi pv. phaseolicola]KPB40888.1 Uncharacterized protein AC515_1740 [Pseudomonas savastanoi pv. phaseolicola]
MWTRVTWDVPNALLSLDRFTQNDLRALRKKYEAMGGEHDIDAPLPMAGAEQRI